MTICNHTLMSRTAHNHCCINSTYNKSLTDSQHVDLNQRGPTTFFLWVIFQRHDNLWATSNKMMYETTDS